MRLAGDAAEERWLLELFELAPRLIRLMDTVLRGLSPPVTFRQYRLLERVAEGYTTLTEISKVATLSLPAISESLDVLVRKGLLTRRIDNDDRRLSQLVLTTDGRVALRRARQELDWLADRLLKGVPDAHEQTGAYLRAVNEQVTAALQDRR